MPIHLRAEPGDYAPAVLCPGDPRRATYIAEKYLEDARLVNEERGLLGYTGTFEGKPLSVQATGMGCPSASIVFEELFMLGATRLVRVGTTGGMQPQCTLGEIICAVSATPHDTTALVYTGGEQHAPTAHFGLVHEAYHIAKQEGRRLHVGPVVTSSVFYNPDTEQLKRWADRGHLGVEMEASALFTIAALRGKQAAAFFTVSDTVIGEFVRISDDALQAGVDAMMHLAARVAVSDRV